VRVESDVVGSIVVVVVDDVDVLVTVLDPAIVDVVETVLVVTDVEVLPGIVVVVVEPGRLVDVVVLVPGNDVDVLVDVPGSDVDVVVDVPGTEVELELDVDVLVVLDVVADVDVVVVAPGKDVEVLLEVEVLVDVEVVVHEASCRRPSSTASAPSVPDPTPLCHATNRPPSPSLVSRGCSWSFTVNVFTWNCAPGTASVASYRRPCTLYPSVSVPTVPRLSHVTTNPPTPSASTSGYPW